MYKIIGGDQKEYGPVTSEQVRQWVTEGRANGQTLILAEGTTDWKPLSAFPEFAALFVAPPAAAASGQPWSPEACLARDYELDLMAYLSRSWRLLHQHLALFAGMTFLVMLLMLLFNGLIAVYTRPAAEALEKNSEQVFEFLKNGNTQAAMDALAKIKLSPEHLRAMVIAMLALVLFDTIVDAGIALFMLRLIRGREARLTDVLAGFGAPVFSLLMVALLAVMLPVFTFCCFVLPWVYLSVIWLFAVPLVIDKRLNFWAAMELSRKRVHRHLIGVFCVWLVAGLISSVGAVIIYFIAEATKLAGSGSFLGILSFGMSFLVLLIVRPLYHGLRLHAYEDIFRA